MKERSGVFQTIEFPQSERTRMIELHMLTLQLEQRASVRLRWCMFVQSVVLWGSRIWHSWTCGGYFSPVLKCSIYVHKLGSCSIAWGLAGSSRPGSPCRYHTYHA
jgi:hypothetical protein